MAKNKDSFLFKRHSNQEGPWASNTTSTSVVHSGTYPEDEPDF